MCFLRSVIVLSLRRRHTALHDRPQYIACMKPLYGDSCPTAVQRLLNLRVTTFLLETHFFGLEISVDYIYSVPVVLALLLP
jgi:hypothetical protein